MPAVKQGESLNDYMSRCMPVVMKEGKSQKQAAGQCAGMYKQHKKNMSMNKKRQLQYFTVNLDSKHIKTDYLEGEEHFVVPVAMMTEGVHEGSRGALMYEGEDLDRWAPAWNHKPVVVNHPPKGSACTQDYLNTHKVGIILNTRYDNKQRAEAWLNKKRLKQFAPQIYKAVQNKQPAEVSTGLHVDLKGGPGRFKGKKYIAVAKNHRPDHLALLTSGEGACSIADGAGLGVVNKKKRAIRKELLDRIVDEIFDRNFSSDKQKSLAKSGAARPDGSPPQRTRQGNKKGNDMAKVKNKKRAFVSALIANELTNFTDDDHEWLMSLNSSQLKAMAPKVKFGFATQEELDEAVQEGIESGLAENLRDPKKRKKLLQKLVANDDPDDDDDDLDEDDVEARNRRLAKKGKRVNNCSADDDDEPEDLDSYLERAPGPVRAVLNQALSAAREEHGKLIKVITANKANVYSEDQLKKMDLNMLRGLAALAGGSDGKRSGSSSYFGSATPESGVKNKKNDGLSEDEILTLPVFNQETANKYRQGWRRHHGTKPKQRQTAGV